MWGNISTDIFNTYAHLSDTDIENEVPEKSGIKTPKSNKKKILEPLLCSRCRNINGPTANYCTTCGLPLTEEAQQVVRNADEQMHQLFLPDSQVQATFLQIITTMKNSASI
jgi:integrase/recombinase XerD